MLNTNFKNQGVSSLIALIIFTSLFWIKPFFARPASALAFWLTDLFVFVLVPIFLFRILKIEMLPKYALYNGSKIAVKLTPIKLFLCSFWGFFLLFVVYVNSTEIGYFYLEKYSVILPNTSTYKEKIPTAILLKILVVAYFSLTAGIVEEIFYRGLVNTVVGKMLFGSRLIYIALSAVLFSSIHAGTGLVNVFATFFAGITLASLYVLTKDLRVPIIVHSAYGLIYWSQF